MKEIKHKAGTPVNLMGLIEKINELIRKINELEKQIGEKENEKDITTKALQK